MKNKTFGDITEISSYKEQKINTTKFRNEGIEFLSENDVNSARAYNRPIRQIYEDYENGYELLQTLSKMVLMDKESGILPDICEEFNIDNLKIDFFFDDKLRPYLRIPTGAFFVNLREERKEFKEEKIEDLKPKYKYEEEKDFSKKYYLNSDHDSVIIFNKPNVELFERELAKHYNIDLNEQTNDINVSYTVENGKLNYKCNFTRFIYDANNRNFITKKSILKQIKNKKEIDTFEDVFELANSTINKLSSYPEKDGLFSLEEEIPLFEINGFVEVDGIKNVNYKYEEGNYCLFYRMGDYHDNEEMYRYSLSGNYGICKESDEGFLLDYNDIKLFSFNLFRDSQTKRYKITNKKTYLPKLNRASFDIKNLSVSNNYIGVDGTGWHLCKDPDVSNMIK